MNCLTDPVVEAVYKLFSRPSCLSVNTMACGWARNLDNASKRLRSGAQS